MIVSESCREQKKNQMVNQRAYDLLPSTGIALRSLRVDADRQDIKSAMEKHGIHLAIDASPLQFPPRSSGCLETARPS